MKDWSIYDEEDLHKLEKMDIIGSKWQIPVFLNEAASCSSNHVKSLAKTQQVGIFTVESYFYFEDRPFHA